MTFLPFGTLEQVRGDVGLSYTQAGLLVTLLSAGGVLPVLTVAADYVDRGVLARLGALGCAAGMAAFGLGGSFPVLAVACVVWGVGSEALVSGCEVALVDVFEDDPAPQVSRMSALGAVGDVLGPVTVVVAAALGLGWRTVFLAGGALMLLYGGWLAGRPFPPSRPPDDTTPWSGLRAVFTDPEVMTLAALTSLVGVLEEPCLGFAVACLEGRGMTPGSAAAMAGVATAGGLAGFLAAPSLLRRVRLRRVLAGFSFATAASIGVIAAGPLAAVPAAASVFGLSVAVVYSALWATTLSARAGLAGTTSAAVSLLSLPAVGVPVAVGAVADAAGLPAALFLYALVPAVLVVVAAGTRRLAPEP